MGIMIDLIICGILIISILMGYKKGLVNVVLKLCAFLISLIITIILFHPISLLIVNNTQLDEKIEQTVIENLNKQNETENNDENQNTKVIDKYIEENINKTQDSVTEQMAKSISENVINVITAIVLFIAVRIILIFFSFVLEGIAEFPIINQFNKLGGIIYGILRAIVIIYFLLTIIFFIISVGGVETITQIINQTTITKILYNNNIILTFLL